MSSSNKTYLPPTTPFMSGIALLLWGWECDYLIYAIPMALLLETARLIPWKIKISNNEFNYIADLTSIIFLLVAIYIFIEKSYHGIYIILSILPLLLFLLILSQVYSIQGFIKPSTLFISLRRLESNDIDTRDTGIDLSYPYLFVCIISASSGNHHAILFYIFTIILISWVLWSLKPAHSSVFLWLFLLLSAAGGGYVGQIGMIRLQSIAESSFISWFDQFMWRSRDPRRTSTAIGTLGKLKQSDRIVLRVNTHGKILKSPLLLREATYINYGYGVWTNYQETFHLIDPVPQKNEWILNKSSKIQDILTIGYYLDDETAVIPAPQGIGSITNVIASQIEYSPYGIISFEFNPGWIKYDVLYDQDKIYDSGPEIEDLDVPEMYKKDLLSLVRQLGLDTKDPENIVETVKRFFADNFKYSLTQNERYPRGKYLSKFLFETRKGHCEYFATATALLLRAAGIPARYVVGYSVSEYSSLEKQYIARARHAHSWVLAFVNGNWQTVDTTPSIWVADEEENISTMEPLIDLWSWFSYRISRWNSNDSDDKITNVLVWFLLPLLFFYIWNIFIKKQVRTRTEKTKEALIFKKYGIDSPFYKLVEEVEKRYRPRKPGQTLLNWIPMPGNTLIHQDMNRLVMLHYKYRFDPEGLTRDQKESMDSEIEKKLTEIIDS